MTELRCALCSQSVTANRRYVHAAAMPEPIAALTPEERERRCRSEGDLLLLDGGARGFVAVSLDLPMRHTDDEHTVELVVWVELTKGAWRSLRSVEKPGTSAEVAGVLASRVATIDGALGEHVRVRKRADEPRARIVAAGKGKLARLERPGSLSDEDRLKIEAAIASEVASAIAEGFLDEKIGRPSARWRDDSPRDEDQPIVCVKIEGAPVTYATVGAAARAQREGASEARVELTMQTRQPSDERVPTFLLALARQARRSGVMLVPGMRLELPGPPLLDRSDGPSDRSFVWLAPATFGSLRGGPLVLGPVHLHFVRAVPLHADEDALLARDGADALARRLDRAGCDPTDLARPSALRR